MDIKSNINNVFMYMYAYVIYIHINCVKKLEQEISINKYKKKGRECVKWGPFETILPQASAGLSTALVRAVFIWDMRDINHDQF